MSILEKTGESLDTSRTNDRVASSSPSTMTVAIIKGMAVSGQATLGKQFQEVSQTL